MSEFIISSISQECEKYICHDRFGKLSVTTRKEKATKYQEAGKAWRVLQTQIPKKKRSGWKVIAMEIDDSESKTTEAPKRFRAEIDIDSVTEEYFDWEKVRHNITESFQDIIAYKERLTAQLNKVEDELCDCEHACEFFKCDAAHGYKLYRMIRDRRIKRRYLKDELWKIKTVLSMSYTDIANGCIDDRFREIEEQSYEPRVLTELFIDTMKTDQ